MMNSFKEYFFSSVLEEGGKEIQGLFLTVGHS